MVGTQRNTHLLLFALFISIFGLAFLRIHLRVQTTLTGYRLGTLKEKESVLLEENSQLKMNLAQITTKRYLEYMATQKPHDVKQELAKNH